MDASLLTKDTKYYTVLPSKDFSDRQVKCPGPGILVLNGFLSV